MLAERMRKGEGAGVGFRFIARAVDSLPAPTRPRAGQGAARGCADSRKSWSSRTPPEPRRTGLWRSRDSLRRPFDHPMPAAQPPSARSSKRDPRDGAGSVQGAAGRRGAGASTVSPRALPCRRGHSVGGRGRGARCRVEHPAEFAVRNIEGVRQRSVRFRTRLADHDRRVESGSPQGHGATR